MGDIDIDINIDEEKQPLVIISTLGNVSNGKSSLIRTMTGSNPMTHSKELKKNMTINLGYTNIKFYKCETCLEENCYKINEEICEKCGTKNKLKLHASICDCPGHQDLRDTSLSGATNMDFCLLVVSTDCEKDLITNDHYKTIERLNLKDSTIIVHNKLDLISKEKALENYGKIKKIYDVKYVIPMCVQFGFGLNYLIKYMVESIPRPINKNFIEKIKKPLKGTIIRSFDVNKPGTEINKLCGSVIGITIKTGKIKIGDEIKIIPGIIYKNGTHKEIKSYVNSLKTENTSLEVAYPGGLIGVGLSIDPCLGKEDRLIGNFIVNSNDENNKIFKTCTIKYEEENKKECDEIKIKKKETYKMIISSTKRLVKIDSINKENKTVKITSSIVFAGEVGDKMILLKSGKIELYGSIYEIH